ncbi:MAG TPA: hypothetical protein VN193_09145 [Candidatus Angelobacter sp.]|jgi:hypothetical protein|nr:hypothetical protein [Candidatus Angelobacter sp.]
MSRRWALIAATPAALAGLAIATSGAFAGTAGTPVAQNELLCGMFTAAADNFAGQSDIDHPDGATSSGKTYPYSGQNCEASQPSSDGTYAWTIAHSNVHTGGGPQDERGTEHVEFALTVSGGQEAGAQGHVTNFDLSSADKTADTCGSRDVFYASGHQFDAAGSCSPSGPGNFNTHGGAAAGNHFRGNYGTVVYQWGDMTSMSPCQKGSMNYCFEAVLEGQTN